MKVRIGYGLGAQRGLDRTSLAELIDGLEARAFDSLWLSERVTGPAPDPIIGLTFAAARTERLKLGTSVQVLPGRNPALLAKELASLDVLSNGRFLPAFGLGNVVADEQQAFGVAREERAPWFNEALPLIRRLWSEDRVDHDGPRFHYEQLTVRPKPVQQPLDVWLGGRAPSELRRVGRLGDGWLASFVTPDDCAAARPVIETAARDAGRAIDPEHFGAMVFYAPSALPSALADRLAAVRPGADAAELVPIGLHALRKRVEAFVAINFSKLVLVPVEEPKSWDDELQTLTPLLELQS
jgi:probable F420-dependent oxidoreductase